MAISTNFPKQCNEWRVATADTDKFFREEMIKRQDKVCQELNGQELSLRRTLRDAVVDDVMKLFPYVFIRSDAPQVQYAKSDYLNSSIEYDHLSSRAREDSESNTSHDISRRKFDVWS